MNLQIFNFPNKTHFCKSHYGKNISPKVSWNFVNNAKSYLLIFQDPDSVSGLFIHWFIPFISPTINTIDELHYNNYNYNNSTKKYHNVKILQGKNTLGKFGYYGPCAPKGSGVHHYIFTIYALDIILDSNVTYDNFYNYIKNHIIEEDSKSFIISK